jgi:hypothetical protein
VIPGIELRSDLIEILLDHIEDPVEFWNGEHGASTRRASFDALPIPNVQEAESSVLLDLRICEEVRKF